MDESLRDRLTPEQFRITQNCGTEPPFSGPLLNEHRDGTFHCVVCGTLLFASDTKFDSGSGWPSFTDPAESEHVRMLIDRSLGMTRTEVRCARCDAHLGHVFDDGPGASGQRWCINSAAMTFDVAADES
jgi:peptide-methionine (R)-S-oxide reductase